MEMNHFIGKIEENLEDIKPGTLKPETDFRTLETWSSMHALIILGMIDSEYGILVPGEEFRKCKTVNDLFTLVKSLKK